MFLIRLIIDRLQRILPLVTRNSIGANGKEKVTLHKNNRSIATCRSKLENDYKEELFIPDWFDRLKFEILDELELSAPCDYQTDSTSILLRW